MRNIGHAEYGGSRKTVGHQVDDISEAAFDPETPRSFPLDFPSWGDAQGALIGIPFMAGAFAVTILVQQAALRLSVHF